MGNEVSGEGNPHQSSSSQHGMPSGTYLSPTKSIGQGSANGKGLLSVNTEDEFASFSTPNATPSVSVRPSPSTSTRVSPTYKRYQSRESNESLQVEAQDSSFQSSSRDLSENGAKLSSPPRVVRGRNATASAGGDVNDTLDTPPQHALHICVINSPDSLEDHAWMDPVLAAAAAGAASKRSRDALEQSQRPSVSFRVDDEWRASLQKLASTTRSTASSFAHMAAPVLSDVADTIKKSATGESFQTSTGEDDDRERGIENDSSGLLQETEEVNVHERLTMKKDSRQHPNSETGALLDEKLKGSLQRLASTTQSAATAFTQVARPVLADATDAVKKSVIDSEESNQVVKSSGRKDSNLQHKQMDDDETVPASDGGIAQAGGSDDAVVPDIDWKESVERLVSTTKSAAASLSNLCCPIFEEAADALQAALPDTVSVKQNEQGKYGGVGYRPIIRENSDGDETNVEWKESLQRLASSTTSTAASLFTVASPMLSESASAVIEIAKEAAEAYQASVERSTGHMDASYEKEVQGLTTAGRESNSFEDKNAAYVEQPNESDLMVSLDTSQDETILTSPGWHDKKTPLRAHRAPPRDKTTSAIDGNVDSCDVKEKNDSGCASTDSLVSPGSIDMSKSLASRTTISSPEKTRRLDRDDGASVTSSSVTSLVSSRRQGHREKNMLSSPGRFVEMVSKRLVSDSSGYPPTHGRGRKSSHRTSGAASRTGSITPSPNIVFDRSIQSVFHEERQRETHLSPPDSPQQSGSMTMPTLNTPPRQPPQEVTLWDMVPESDSQMVGEGSFVIEPHPRIVLESAPAHFQDDIRPGSTYSSEEESLPLSTGFIGKRKNTYDSNDTASDPGKMPLKKHRKSRRWSQMRLRSSRNTLLPPMMMSPSSSAIFGDTLNLDTRSTFEETSPGSLQASEIPFFRSPEADGDSKISEIPDLQDKMLDEALMMFSSLEDVDFLSEIPAGSVSESLQSLASLRWRQLTANWEHDEMMRAITMRPCSVHFFNDPYQDDERPNDWSETWTTTVYRTNRDTLFSLHDEFRKSRKTSPSMANLSGFNPLLLDAQFQYLTPYLPRLGPAQKGDVALQVGDHVKCVILKHSIDAQKEITIKDLLASAIAKSTSYTAVMKQIATFATNNADPMNPSCAVRYSVDVKTADAIIEKAKRKYEGDVLQVKDILRGQITFPNESSLACAIASLNTMCDSGKSSVGEQETIKIARVKNLFLSRPAQTPLTGSLPTGYRHILITLKFGDGFLAEMQLQLSQMFDILGQDGYNLHKELTRVDAICNKIETPNFNRYPCDITLRKILGRMFRAQLQQSDTLTSVGEASTRVEQYDEAPSRREHDSNDESKVEPIPQPAGNGIAAAATLAASRRTLKSTDTDDEKPTHPPFLAEGGIAAAAAAEAARKRDEKASEGERKVEETGDGNESAFGPPPFLGRGGIAAAAAEAARKREEKASEDESEIEDVTKEEGSSGRPASFLAGGGIAEAAAEAARKREKASEESNEVNENVDDKETSGRPAALLAGGGIGAAAAEAARKREKKASEGKSKLEETVDEKTSAVGSPPFLGGGIAAAAAEAARKREKASEENSEVNENVDDKETSGRPSPFLARGGIAAAAAEAARKREKKASEGKSKVEETVDGNTSAVGPPPFLGGGGIAAAAAEAARKREKASEDICKHEDAAKEEGSSGRPPSFLAGGGIAAAAAEAARKREKKVSEGESKVEETVHENASAVSPPPFLGAGGIAAAAAEAARKRDKASEENSGVNENVDYKEASGRPASFLAAGGIAAAAAEAARKREEKASEGRSEVEETVDENASAVSPPPFLVGGGIAAAAAEAARKREKASEENSNVKETMDNQECSECPPPFLGEGGIAAAAAEAARNRQQKTPAEEARVAEEQPGGNGTISSPGDESLSEMFNPVASALDVALSDFHVTFSKSEGMAEKEVAVARPSLDPGTFVQATLVPTGGAHVSAAAAAELARFSEKDILQGLILEALKDASGHSRRIATLYCASSLCFFVASMMTHSMGENCSVLSEHQSEDSNTSVMSRPALVNDVELAEDVSGTQPSDAVPSVRPVDEGVDIASRSDVGGGGTANASNEQEEKKEAHEDRPPPPFGGGGIAAAAAAAALMREKKGSQDKNEEATDNGSGIAAAAASVARRREGTSGVSFSSASSQKGVEPETKNEAFSLVSLPPLDPSLLVDVSAKALLRGLTIANQASSQGMIARLAFRMLAMRLRRIFNIFVYCG